MITKKYSKDGKKCDVTFDCPRKSIAARPTYAEILASGIRTDGA